MQVLTNRQDRMIIPKKAIRIIMFIQEVNWFNITKNLLSSWMKSGLQCYRSHAHKKAQVDGRKGRKGSKVPDGRKVTSIYRHAFKEE